MKSPHVLFALLGMGSVAIVACSGAPGTELFADPGTSQFSPGPETPAGNGSTSSSASSTGGSGSSTSSASSTSSSGGSTTSSGGSTSSSGGVDAGLPPGTGIYCGEVGGVDTFCNPDSQVCCANAASGYQCKQNGIISPCTGNSLTIGCNDKTDCGFNQVCCGAFGQNSGYKSVGCALNCNNSPIPGLTAVRFCDKNAAVDECAETGKVCSPSGSLPGFSVCK